MWNFFHDSPRPRGLLPALFVASLALSVWYGHVGLDAGRYSDERYAFENIASLLRSHSLRPVSGFHPILSYLPHGLVLLAAQDLARLFGGSDSLILAGEGLTPFGYLLGRFVQSLFGALSVLLTYRIGRLLYGPRAALIAAILVATAPWYVRQSGLINEDATLIFFSLVAFAWSLDAARAPALGTFLKAGLGIGLALSTKFNAGPIALPLVAAALGSVRRERRMIGWLCAAGAVSLGVFLLLNPYVLIQPELYRNDFGRTLSDYAAKSQSNGTSRPGVLLFAATTALSPNFLSWTAVATFLGIALLLWRLRPKSATPEPQRIEGAMLLAFLLGYPLLYALATTNPSDHNFLHLVPFGAIVAGWVIDRGWQRTVAGGSQSGSRHPLPLLPAAVLALVQGALVLGFVYQGTVVPTIFLAERELLRRFGRPEGRIVFFEGTGHGPVVERRQERSTVVAVERLSTLPLQRLDGADAEVFPSTSLDGVDGDFFRARLAGDPTDRVVRFAPSLFGAFGPELTAVFHLWRPAADRRAIPLRAEGSILIGSLLPGPEGSWGTIELSLHRPRIRHHSPPPRLTLNGRSVPLLWVRTQRDTLRVATGRLRSPLAPAVLRVRLATAGSGKEAAYLRWWYPPAAGTAGAWPMLTLGAPPGHFETAPAVDALVTHPPKEPR